MSKSIKKLFLFYLISSILISIFLFQTVHNRNVDIAFKDSTPRYMNLINFWVEHGFIDNFGLWPRNLEAESFNNIANQNNKFQAFYRNDGMGYLHPSYLVQKIYHFYTGELNNKIYIYQNQLYLILASIFLSILSFKICLSYNLNATNSFLMGLVSQLMYLTFPVNLFYYWGAYPTAISSVFIILFLLLIFEMNVKIEKVNFKFKIFTALTIFFICHTALYVGILFLIFFTLTYLLLQKKFFNLNDFLLIILLPSALSIFFFISQLLITKINYDPEFLGSSFNFRTGFDGDISYYKSYVNLIFHRIRDGSTLYQWYEFMVFSFLSVLIYFSINIYSSKISNKNFKLNDNAIFVTLVSIGAYFPYALIFTQSTVIHAKVFDPYLIIPLIIISFSNLPSMLERGSKSKGLFCYIFFGIGIFFSIINLRLYSIEYPL